MVSCIVKGKRERFPSVYRLKRLTIVMLCMWHHKRGSGSHIANYSWASLGPGEISSQPCQNRCCALSDTTHNTPFLSVAVWLSNRQPLWYFKDSWWHIMWWVKIKDHVDVDQLIIQWFCQIVKRRFSKKYFQSLHVCMFNILACFVSINPRMVVMVWIIIKKASQKDHHSGV